MSSHTCVGDTNHYSISSAAWLAGWCAGAHTHTHTPRGVCSCTLSPYSPSRCTQPADWLVAGALGARAGVSATRPGGRSAGALGAVVCAVATATNSTPVQAGSGSGSVCVSSLEQLVSCAFIRAMAHANARVSSTRCTQPQRQKLQPSALLPTNRFGLIA